MCASLTLDELLWVECFFFAVNRVYLVFIAYNFSFEPHLSLVLYCFYDRLLWPLKKVFIFIKL